MVDDPSGPAGTRSARLVLLQSEEALQDLLQALADLAARMRERGAEVPSGELGKARIALTQIRSQLLDEVVKHEKHVLQSNGHVADAPLDFDALRDSIGRKLDRIRAARDPE
ncbi:MAG: hypothetical protein OIF48_12365 [Silicimonas sp.]|nr:hypothetical protein [Silicimonas sp.]